MVEFTVVGLMSVRGRLGSIVRAVSRKNMGDVPKLVMRNDET